MDKFTLVDFLVLGVGALILVCLLAAAILLKKISSLTRRAEAENNKLKRENQELRDRIEELTPKPQTQSIMDTAQGLADHIHFRVHQGANPPPPHFGLGNQMQVQPAGRMFEGRPENMAPPPFPAVSIYQTSPGPKAPSRHMSSVPSSSRVRDVHHHHHHHDDNTLLHVAVAASLLSSSDDTSTRSTPSCAPSRDDSYSAPSDSGDSGSPSCD